MILTELVPKILFFFREAFETHSMTVFKNQIKKFWLKPKKTIHSPRGLCIKKSRILMQQNEFQLTSPAWG